MPTPTHFRRGACFMPFQRDFDDQCHRYGESSIRQQP